MMMSLWLRLGAVAALVLAVWGWGHYRYVAGVKAERERWEVAQMKADRALAAVEAEARDTSTEIVSEAKETAAETVAKTRVTTATASERVRHVVRTIEVPVDRPLPVLPVSVHAEGRAAVERARAAQRYWLPAGADP